MILPVFDVDTSPFYRKVRYVDDVASVMSSVVKRKDTILESLSNGETKKQVELAIDTNTLGAIKHKRWAFEEESRYTLIILPGNPYRDPAGPTAERILNDLLNERGVSFTHYDMHLKPAVLDSMEITMSPSSLPGHRIIVESLCSKFAPKAVVRDSDLTNLVKLKE